MEIVQAANDRDWDRMASRLTADAVMHDATQGLGSTVVRVSGGDGIVADHRRAAEKLGLTWEILGMVESEDLLTTLVVLHFPNGKRALSGAVVRFDGEGLVCDIYAYIKPPTGSKSIGAVPK
jgi:hypothetical protein